MNDILFYVIFGAIVLYGIYYLILNNNEGRKRKAMIINTNDYTVAAYIKAFKSAKGNFILRSLRPGNSETLYLESKMNQVQAWEIVKDSPNVSQSLKDELRKIFLKCDIPIKP